MPDVNYGSLPFAEQIAFFRRKLNLLTNAWTDIWNQAHDHAFVVAGANRDDLLADFRAAIDKIISQGMTLQQFRKEFDRIVATHGWDYNGGRNWRSRVIYETNLRTSYAAGRYAQLQAVKRFRPFWKYVHCDSVQHPRPLHLAWNGLILHADDPWWNAHFPPNGWGCQCSIQALSQDDLDRKGLQVGIAPPEDLQMVTIGQRGGSPRTVEVPAGVDPGFGYTPGKDAWLRERAIAAIEDAAAPTKWEPLVQTTPADLGRPAIIPMFPAPVPLGPMLTSVDDTVAAIEELLDGPTRVFDVHGLPVAVDAKVLGAHIVEKDFNRTPYLPLLLDLLNDPWEVWYALETDPASGATRIRARIIKAYDVRDGRILLFVANEVDGVLTGWTLFQNANQKYMNAQRQGVLWFGGDGP